MATAKRKRRRLFVDKNVQGGLLLRVTGYWFFCLITVSLMVLCWTVLTGPRAPAAVTFARVFHAYLPALVASVFLLPMVLIDCNRFTNRFVGPILRLRRNLRQLADGETVPPLKFRPKDFWLDVADSFNDVLARTSNPPEAAAASNPPAPEDTVPETTGYEPATWEPCDAEPAGVT